MTPITIESPAPARLTQAQIDAIVYASREADEGPTDLCRRVERAVQPVPAGYWLAPDEPTPEIIEAICREMVPGRWPDAYSPETQLIWRQDAAQAHRAMRAAHLAATGETPHG